MKKNPFKTSVRVEDLLNAKRSGVVAEKIAGLRKEPFSAGKAPIPAGPHIFLGLPCGTLSAGFYADTNIVSALSMHQYGIRVQHAKLCISSLTHNFNSLFVTAWNNRKTEANVGGFTHFLLLHDDIRCLDRDWLKQLYDELVNNNLEMISAIVPIKDDRGITSTALDTYLWRPRRLTQYEVTQLLPVTWTNADILGDDWHKKYDSCYHEVDARSATLPDDGGPDVERKGRIDKSPNPACKLEGPVGVLLPNTGVMLIDLAAPWASEVCFEFRNKTRINEKGHMEADFEPEDWRFGRFLASKGARYGVTRRIRLHHQGGQGYSSEAIWGAKWDWQNVLGDCLNYYGESKPNPPPEHLPPDTRHPRLGGCILENDIGDPRSWMPAKWKHLVEHYHVKTVLDIGCGGGFSARYFRDKLDCKVVGIEAFKPAIEHCKTKGIDVIVHDYKDGFISNKELVNRFGTERIDLAWCCEVVEHIEPEYIDNLLSTFKMFCKYVVMTNALPGEPGHHHVNTQPVSYWVKKMEEAGFEFKLQETEKLRAVEDQVDPKWGSYQGKLLLFKRKQ